MKPSRPKILWLDGLDGTGKATMTDMLREQIHLAGKKVAIMDFPRYEERTGRLVKDYLTSGYGCIQDRSLAAILYSVDRTMELRERFDELFTPGNYDYIVSNRFAMANLICQTTMYVPTVTDQEGVLTPRKPLMNRFRTIPSNHTTYFIEGTDEDNPLRYEFTLYGMHDYVNGNKDVLDIVLERDREVVGGCIEQIYPILRYSLINDMANLLYRIEIEPWVATDGNGIQYMPFADIDYVILTSDTPKALQENMLNRYSGHEDEMDAHERNAQYMLSMAENVDFIHRNYDDIFWNFSKIIRSYSFKNPIITAMQEYRALSIFQGPPDCFRFHKISVTDSKGQMRKKDSILHELWRWFGLDREIGDL